MPYLHSLSIRLRGGRNNKSTSTSTSTPTSSSTNTTTTSPSIKQIFLRVGRTQSQRTNKDNDIARMGNAPSDMNSPRQRLAQLARSVTDTESVRSASGMPGAAAPHPRPRVVPRAPAFPLSLASARNGHGGILRLRRARA
ncbi:hypothetical protein ONZ51_g12666 [Trametes cubensis]|uniref:Uncharacterized protein n=1 Tax=Trametes cubensis TaxID=1111947 RepID=A0AAD7THV5_9APHY|nr:hypothetical protein ONZ51_g12666 [Trametes cubensis]